MRGAARRRIAGLFGTSPINPPRVAARTRPWMVRHDRASALTDARSHHPLSRGALVATASREDVSPVRRFDYA